MYPSRAAQMGGPTRILLVPWPNLNVCTIIAKNYVAHARVLAQSLADTHSDSRLWVLVIDDFGGYIAPESEPFAILTPAQIGCEPFLDMALRYSVLELSTAVKPWLLRHLMDETQGPVTYLDPDIRVYGSLHRLDELAERHGVVLIPHNTAPIPQDGRTPSQVDVMIAGIYNLGYVSLASRPEVDRLLDWWAERLRRDCRVDPVWGYFVDQRWFDLAPGFLSDLAIARDPEFNVAYWNLHDRRLERAGESYTVNGRPLAFFHFSGFDPERPLVLSRHQNRIDVLKSPPLERILADYARSVLDAGHAESRHWPYEFAALGDGTRVDDTLRALYDEYATEQPSPLTSPFTLDGAMRFDHWLREPAPAGPGGISRALAHVYRDRAEVRRAFPDLEGPEDRDAFLSWAAGAGATQEPLLARVYDDGGRAALPPQARTAAPLTAAASRPQPNPSLAPLRDGPWGVNLVGRLRDNGEPGQVARSVLNALDASGARVLPVVYPDQIGEASLPVNLICLGPEVLPDYVKLAGGRQFAGRYSAGLWAWPVEGFPEAWSQRFSLLEEVWAPSAHVAMALSAAASVPVHTLPLAVAAKSSAGDTYPRHGERGFVFICRHDHREDFERQNPLGVLRAFTRAFGPDDGARLVIETIGSGTISDRHAELVRAAPGRGDVEIRDLSSAGGEARANAEARAGGDCFVSLHRAEAFGMPMAQAMLRGKPVIATGYSGNLDYMSADNSHLVDHRLVAIGPGRDPYPAQSRWAEPDLDHAAALMRLVFENPEAASVLGAAGAESICATHSPQVAGEAIFRRLESIRATGVVRRGPDTVLEQPATLSRLPLRIAQGPFSAAPGAGQAARERLRRVVLQVIKPFTRYQQVVNADLVAAIADLHLEIERERTRADAERADRLARDRRDDELRAELGALTARLAELQSRSDRG
jgi:glycosyltransferase involved in cell wall biosynthesis